MAERTHRHWIIQQIMPAPTDCYAVFAHWDLHDSTGGTVEAQFLRVPCFALVAECKTRWESQHATGGGFAVGVCPCAPDLETQEVSPCVESGYGGGGYIPTVDDDADCDNWKFLGLHYEGSKGNKNPMTLIGGFSERWTHSTTEGESPPKWQ